MIFFSIAALIKPGEEGGKEPACVQVSENRPSRSQEEEFLDLLVEPCRCSARNGGGQLTNDLPRSRFYDEVMGCGKTNGTEHSYRVFSKSYIRIADGTNEPLLEVAQSGAVVDNRKIGDVIGKGVDREVTAEGILFRGTEDIVTKNHSILVLEVTGRLVAMVCLCHVPLVGRDGSPECGDFQDFVLKVQMGQPETATYETAVAKEPFDLTGRCVCCYVEVLGGALQEQVADTPPNEVGNEAVVMEPVERAQGIRAYLLPGYTMFRSGYDAWLHGPHHSTPDRKSEIPAAGISGGNPGDSQGKRGKEVWSAFREDTDH